MITNDGDPVDHVLEILMSEDKYEFVDGFCCNAMQGDFHHTLCMNGLNRRQSSFALRDG